VHATDPTIRRYLLRNPTAPEIIPQLREFAQHGIQFHTQIVMSPGVNDGPIMRQTLSDLYEFGPAILGCSVVPVGLTEYSKHHLVREPTAAECGAAIKLIEERAAIAKAERQIHWAFGADELYVRAGVELPPPEIYDGFDQVENGVGAVRWLQQRIETASGELAGWAGKRIGVVTGTAMAPLMPMVLEPLGKITAANFELIPVVNTLFGATVTTAGLLPGTAIQAALKDRQDLDLALLPGESINDDMLFIDSMSLDLLTHSTPVELRLSHDFTDVLQVAVHA
jgi:NifB/MoaA-like Fe-S oxidoreductase